MRTTKAIQDLAQSRGWTYADLFKRTRFSIGYCNMLISGQRFPSLACAETLDRLFDAGGELYRTAYEERKEMFIEKKGRQPDCFDIENGMPLHTGRWG